MILFSYFTRFRFFSLYVVFLLYRFRRFFSLDFVFLLHRFRWISFSYFTDFVSFRSISFSYFTDFVGFCFRFVSFLFSVYRYPDLLRFLDEMNLLRFLDEINHLFTLVNFPEGFTVAGTTFTNTSVMYVIIIYNIHKLSLVKQIFETVKPRFMPAKLKIQYSYSLRN